jgi:hypothetical protein
MQDGMKARRDHEASGLASTMAVVIAAFLGCQLFAMICALSAQPMLDPDMFLSMLLAP